MSPIPPCPCTHLRRGEPLEVPGGGWLAWHTSTESLWGGMGRVRTQGTAAPDPMGGGGPWGQTATRADPAMEQVGPWGIGKGLHRLAETQPSALPAVAVAPAPGPGDKLHPHLGLVQQTQQEHGAVSPPPSTGSQGSVSQGGAEERPGGEPRTGRSGQGASCVYLSRPRGGDPGTSGLGLGRLCLSRTWRQDSEPPPRVLGSPLLVHDAQTPCDAGPSASRTRNPDLQGCVCVGTGQRAWLDFPWRTYRATAERTGTKSQSRNQGPGLHALTFCSALLRSGETRFTRTSPF